MKIIEELITKRLFADYCTLLAHMEEALKHIINHFSSAAQNLGFTISQKKAQVLYQPHPCAAHSPPYISINGTNLNAVEHFTYRGSVISNDLIMPQSARILTTTYPKPAVPLEDCQREYGRVTNSTSPQRSRCTVPLSFPSLCTVQRPGFSIESRSGYWSSFTNAACTPPWHQMARPHVK